MLQLTNCCLEWVKIWRSCNIFWEGIPLDNSQWKEGILIGILTSVNLTDCHGMTIFGYPLSGPDVIGKHKAIYYFIKETKMRHWLSLFRCLPAQLVQQWRDASHSGIIVRGPPVHFSESDSSFSTTTLCWILLKNAWIQCRVESLMPHECNFRMSFEWLTLSKVLKNPIRLSGFVSLARLRRKAFHNGS